MTDDMDAKELEFLQAARLGLGLEPARMEAQLAQLTAGLAALPLATALPATPSVGAAMGSGAVTSMGRAFRWGAAGGLVIGVAVGFGAGQLVARDARPATALPVGPPQSALVAPDDPELVDLSVEPTEDSRAANVTASAPKVARPAVERAATPESPGLALREELEYLRRAQSALREGNPQLALGLMTELETKQPLGALRFERDTTRVLGLCALGRVEEARARASSLLSDPGASVYAGRLEKSCISVPSETEGDAAQHQPTSP